MAKHSTPDTEQNRISLLASPATSTAAVLEDMEETAAPAKPITPTEPLTAVKAESSPVPAKQSKRSRPNLPVPGVRHGIAVSSDDHGSNHQAELFYLQKQIQQQTQMVFILEDGSRIQGIVEWYDRSSIKVRGKSRVLIYKSAIKYLYKAGEVGSAPGV
jgi:sRNA-binding regulator protein Hfq